MIFEELATRHISGKSEQRLLGSLYGLIAAILKYRDINSWNSLDHTIIRVSNSLEPDQGRHSLGFDLGPNYFQRLSEDSTGLGAPLFSL